MRGRKVLRWPAIRWHPRGRVLHRRLWVRTASVHRSGAESWHENGPNRGSKLSATSSARQARQELPRSTTEVRSSGPRGSGLDPASKDDNRSVSGSTATAKGSTTVAHVPCAQHFVSAHGFRQVELQVHGRAKDYEVRCALHASCGPKPHRPHLHTSGHPSPRTVHSARQTLSMERAHRRLRGLSVAASSPAKHKRWLPNERRGGRRRGWEL